MILEGGGHIPLARDPVKVNLLIHEFAERFRARPRAAAPGALGPAGRKRVLYLSLADRPGPRPARPRHRRRSCGERHPDVADRLARPAPGHPGARGGRRAAAPGEPRGWPTSRRTSRASPASTTCTASRRCAGWTRSCCRNFMVFHDVVPGRATTTWWSATRPGTSTTSCTRTPSSSGSPTPG